MAVLGRLPICGRMLLSSSAVINHNSQRHSVERIGRFPKTRSWPTPTGARCATPCGARSRCSTCCSPNAATAARRRAWWVMRVGGVRRFSKRSRGACNADRGGKLRFVSAEDWALVIKKRDRRNRHPARQRGDQRLGNEPSFVPPPLDRNDRSALPPAPTAPEPPFEVENLCGWAQSGPQQRGLR